MECSREKEDEELQIASLKILLPELPLCELNCFTDDVNEFIFESEEFQKRTFLHIFNRAAQGFGQLDTLRQQAHQMQFSFEGLNTFRLPFSHRARIERDFTTLYDAFDCFMLR